MVTTYLRTGHRPQLLLVTPQGHRSEMPPPWWSRFWRWQLPRTKQPGRPDCGNTSPAALALRLPRRKVELAIWALLGIFALPRSWSPLSRIPGSLYRRCRIWRALAGPREGKPTPDVLENIVDTPEWPLALVHRKLMLTIHWNNWEICYFFQATEYMWSVFKVSANNRWRINRRSVGLETVLTKAGTATGYGLDDRGVGVRVPTGSRIVTPP
jgi:hypothetical protein